MKDSDKPKLILIDRSLPAITQLTLNRPDKRNALSIALMEQFVKKIEETELLDDQRVLIINGNGPIFCAGLDLNEAVQSDLIATSASLLAKVFTAIYNSKLLTICSIEGAALAGGGGLAAASDFVIATENAKISYPEVRRGLVPAQVAVLLQRQITSRKLRELLLLGNSIDACTALDYGLVNRVVAEEELSSQAIAYANEFLKGTPEAMIATKKLIRSFEGTPIEEDLKHARAVHEKARHSGEAAKGIADFLEKNTIDK